MNQLHQFDQGFIIGKFCHIIPIKRFNERQIERLRYFERQNINAPTHDIYECKQLISEYEIELNKLNENLNKIRQQIGNNDFDKLKYFFNKKDNEHFELIQKIFK